MAVGGWRLAVGGWRLAVGGWRLAVGGWRLAVGGWRLAVGGWRLAVGGWRLAVGGWRLAVFWIESQWIGGSMKDFKRLNVWKKAHEFTLAIYAATKEFPQDERYGLTSQIRRASVSIPSGIAEGCGRNGDPELARFCQIAMGSASEVEYQLLLSHDLGFITSEEYQRHSKNLVEVKRMLNAFIQKLKAKSQPQTAKYQ